MRFGSWTPRADEEPTRDRQGEGEGHVDRFAGCKDCLVGEEVATSRGDL